jgi:hypothetical protein
MRGLTRGLFEWQFRAVDEPSSGLEGTQALIDRIGAAADIDASGSYRP